MSMHYASDLDFVDHPLIIGKSSIKNQIVTHDHHTGIICNLSPSRTDPRMVSQ